MSVPPKPRSIRSSGEKRQARLEIPILQSCETATYGCISIFGFGVWPSAKPVSAEQLTASIQAPAAMGADGVFIWGSSGDDHVSGYSQTITTFLKDTAGPLMEKCSADREKCATALCSGHGRCSNYDAAVSAIITPTYTPVIRRMPRTCI